MFLVQVPATSANLGPGFDCMGLAVKLYNRFTVQESDKLSFVLKGKYTNNIPINENNLVWKTMLRLWQKIDFPIKPVQITLESDVPPARGLGSSSTAVVGGLMIANVLAGSPFDKYELLKIATEIEGHPDNVTPAIYGGITLTVMTEDNVIPRVLVKKPDFRAVVIIPDILVETEKARKILPASVSRQDAVYNSSRVGLLVDAFINKDYSLLKVATQDKLHQEQRASLIPGMRNALKSAMTAGAYGAALSGSGPTLIAFCSPGLEEKIASTMMSDLTTHGLESEAHFLDIDPEGVQVIPDYKS